MIVKYFFSFIDKINEKLNSFLKNNFSKKALDIFQYALIFLICVLIIYFFFIAFTEILLLLILFMLIMIYRKL